MGAKVVGHHASIADIKHARRHTGELEILDQPLRGIKRHVGEMNPISLTVCQEARDKGANFAGTEDQDRMHTVGLYSLAPRTKECLHGLANPLFRETRTRQIPGLSCSYIIDFTNVYQEEMGQELVLG